MPSDTPVKASPADRSSAVFPYLEYDPAFIKMLSTRNVDSLAHYESYRERLAAHPDGIANYKFAMQEKFIRSEERLFLKLASSS